MKPDRLLQHFEAISEAEDAMPRLRRFILDLAVRGKLAEQNSNDEPASKLLKRIQAERARLVKIGSVKEPKSLPPLKDTEIPYSVPSGWKWTRLGDSLNNHLGGGTPSKTNAKYWGGNVLWASVKDIGKSKYVDQTIDRITPEGLKNSSSNLIPEGNLIVVTRMGLGKVSINRAPMAINQDLRALFLSSLVSIDYYYIFFKTASYEGSGLTVKGIKVEQLLNSPFPLPPLAEQHRIVAKVDELMALCNELEAARNKRETHRDRLVAATLQRLNNGNGSPEVDYCTNFREITRFYFNHFPRLTTQSIHIKQLRQAVFNLAIRGKLVAQDSKDEPVSVLLTRIQMEKERLAKEGKLRGVTTISPLEASRGPFAIPDTWNWVSFGEIMISRDGERIPVSKEERHRRAKIYDYYGASGVIDKIDGYLYDKPLLLIGEDGANLINRSTPIAFIARGKYWVNNHAHVLDGITEAFLQYIELYINAVDLKPYVTGTAQPKMNQAKMNSIPIALPPEAEQIRIVAKVDELMALCDELETQLTTAAATHRQLLEATQHEALNSGQGRRKSSGSNERRLQRLSNLR